MSISQTDGQTYQKYSSKPHNIDSWLKVDELKSVESSIKIY